jgi:hypothetical protein
MLLSCSLISVYALATPVTEHSSVIAVVWLLKN